MVEPSRLLDLSTADAVRQIARERMADAAEALTRLRRRKDGEALHDFRVSIRRLRSLLRAYRRWLGRTAATKLRRRLRDVGAATNTGRDAEVQITWLMVQRESLARGERTGLNWLVKQLRGTRRENYQTARRHVRAEYERVAGTLEKRFAEQGDPGPPFRESFTVLLREHAAELEARLAAVHGPEDEEAAHDARISAKRLRYLLEPVRDETDGARALVAHLKELQDLLGTLHDMHVLEGVLLAALEDVATAKVHRLRALALEGDTAAVQRERRRDERLGLVALAARARQERDATFATLAGHWLGGAAQPFFREAADLAAEIGRRTDEPVERERKYLLRRLPEIPADAEVVDIEQGWLPGERLRERLRRSRMGDETRYHRTVKLGAGIERIEIEEETTEGIFTALWPLTDGCRIAKRRYRVTEGAYTWEVDEFSDRALVLAEVELPHADAVVTPPDWLAPYVEREVTGDPAYLNLTLASGGEPPAPRPATRRARRARRAAEATRSP